VPSARKSAHEALTYNLLRASYFLDIHEQLQTGAGAPLNKQRELTRGAVVFAVGALDSYLSEVAAEVILAQFDKGALTGDARSLIAKVAQANPTLALEAAMAAPGVDRLELVRSVITEYFHGRSNHGAKAVVNVVELMDGSTQRLWDRTKALGEERAAADLDDWTDMRHRIVHRGEAPSVRRPAGRRCVLLVEHLGIAINEVAASITAKPPARPGRTGSLNDTQVRAIRTAYAAGGVSQRELGERYKVGAETIGKLLRGQTYQHVT
jgi:hypothetical protein